MLQQIFVQINGKISVYQTIVQKTHGVGEDEAAKIVTGELEAYMARLEKYLTDPQNSAATITVAQGCNIFLEVIQSGLSFSPVANHVYVSRLKGTGTAIGYKVTADGEIYQAQCSGAIHHLSEPVLVITGEAFTIYNTQEGHQVANHTMFFEGRPKFALATFQVGYVYIVYTNGDRELSWIGAERMKELRAKSQNPKMYDDESFVQTKVIKHALRKVRKTPFINQSQLDDAAREFEMPATISQQTSTVAPTRNAPL